MTAEITPLAKKLKLQPGLTGAVVGGPADYLERLGSPEGVRAVTTLDGTARLDPGLRPELDGAGRRSSDR